MRVPLRLRVTLGFAAGMALVLAALGVFLYVRVGQDLLNGVDMQLRSRAQVVVDAIAHRSTRLVRAEGRLIDPDEAFAQVLTPSGRILAASSTVSDAPILPASDLGSVSGPRFFSRQVRGVDDPARLLAIPHGTGPDRVVVVVGTNLGDRHDALAGLALALVIGGPVALALVSWGGWVLAGSALRPVERMRREAAAISLSEPSRRLSVPDTGDELARLGATLNSMLGRLQEAIHKEQRFLDWASHELRTPLGVLKMELELSLARARTPEELKAALENALEETDRLVRLAEHLLVLSRTRDGRLVLHREDTSVAWILQRAASSHRARAGAAGMALSVECPDGVRARVDRERIRQAVDDLVDNSIRHGQSGAALVLSAERSDGRVRIAVRDGGPGFPSELLARWRDGDGWATESGLGLSIVKAIAEAHGGELRIENGDDGGASASLELPA
jgi:two-component system OmpR family sensor kinase